MIPTIRLCAVWCLARWYAGVPCECGWTSGEWCDETDAERPAPKAKRRRAA